MAGDGELITVFGGSQKRPNLHIQDMADLYELLLNVSGDRIAGQIFNAGFQNMSIMEIARIAKRVAQEVFPEKGDIPVVTTPTDDIRSYHVNSDKLRRVLGFEPKHTIEDAVRGLCAAFKSGKLPPSETCSPLGTMSFGKTATPRPAVTAASAPDSAPHV